MFENFHSQLLAGLITVAPIKRWVGPDGIKIVETDRLSLFFFFVVDTELGWERLDFPESKH